MGVFCQSRGLLSDGHVHSASRTGTLNDNDMGPLITAEHRDKVRSYIDIGEEEGATVVVDGRRRYCNMSSKVPS